MEDTNNKDEVLEILTQNLTNERLDKILQQDSVYQDIMKRLDIAFNKFERATKDPELRHIVDEYETLVQEESAYQIKIAYQQGMKDLTQLFVTLIENPSFKAYNI